jgi:hypothetical protein
MTPLVRGTVLVLSVIVLANLGVVYCQELSNAVPLEVGRMRFSFHTDKPEIKLFPKKDDQKEWYSIVFTHLEEYDKDLLVITDAAFGTNFTYSNTTTSGDGTNHVHNLNMSAYIPSGSSFCKVVISNFITEKQVIDNGGDPTTAHSWQFNIQMDGWSFHNVENLLRFHFSVYSSQSQEADIKFNQLKLRGSEGDSIVINFPTGAVADDKQQNVSVDVSVKEAARNDIDHLDVSLLFHSFSHLSYDPTVGIMYTVNQVPLNTGRFPTTAIVLIAVAGIILAVTGSGIGYFVWRRRQVQNKYIRYY